MCSEREDGKLIVTKEELAEMVERILADREARRLASGMTRDPVTRLRDAEGNTWFSATLEKGEILRRLAAIITAAGVIYGGISYSIQRLIVYPAVDEKVQTTMAAHETRVKKQMEDVMPHIVMREEYVKGVARLEQQWISQDKTNDAIADGLREIRNDIKELLKRSR